MTANPPAVKLCLNCRHFVGGACTHESNMKYSFVDGTLGSYNSVLYVRETERRPDGTPLCGQSGRFHERAPDANAYAESMISKDQRERIEGRREHDLDTFGRQLRQGS